MTSIEQLDDPPARGCDGASAFRKDQRLAAREADREVAFSHDEFFDGGADATEHLAEVDVLFARRQVVFAIGTRALVEEEELGIEEEAVPSAVGLNVKKKDEVERCSRDGYQAFATRADERS